MTAMYVPHVRSAKFAVDKVILNNKYSKEVSVSLQCVALGISLHVFGRASPLLDSPDLLGPAFFLRSTWRAFGQAEPTYCDSHYSRDLSVMSQPRSIVWMRWRQSAPAPSQARTFRVLLGGSVLADEVEAEGLGRLSSIVPQEGQELLTSMMAFAFGSDLGAALSRALKTSWCRDAHSRG